MTETALGAALEGAGVNRDENEFLAALAKYLNKGGTIERAEKLLALAAERMSGEGHADSADEGQEKAANARQQNGDAAGHQRRSQKGQSNPARPSPADRGGADHSIRADKGQVQGSRSAREPSATDRKAAAKAAKGAAKAVHDLGWIGQASMPAGPAYSEIRVGELEAFRKRQVRDGVNHGRAAVVLARLHTEVQKLGQADSEAKVFEILPPETIRQVSRETEMDVLGPMASGWLEGFIQQSQNTIAGGGHG